MATPLTHALAAMAAYAGLAVTLGQPAVAPGLLAAGILAMVVDFNERDDHRYHSPLGHSVMFLAIAFGASWALFPATGGDPAVAPQAPLAVLTGLGTHLAIDVFSVGGVYTWPSRNPEGPRWRPVRYRLRFGDHDPLYNLCAVAPSTVVLVAALAF